MDVFDYRAQVVTDTLGVFDGNDDPRDDISGCFLRLKNLTTTEIHTRWDIAYLEEYVRENMVPRSLRWEVNPQKGDNELIEWFKYFNEAGVQFLKFLIAKKTRKLASLDFEINTIKSKLFPFKNEPEYIQKSDTLKAILIKEETEQKIKKKKKYNRDKKDYKDNVVFKWQVVPAITPAPLSGGINLVPPRLDNPNPMGGPIPRHLQRMPQGISPSRRGGRNQVQTRSGQSNARPKGDSRDRHFDQRPSRDDFGHYYDQRSPIGHSSPQWRYKKGKTPQRRNNRANQPRGPPDVRDRDDHYGVDTLNRFDPFNSDTREHLNHMIPQHSYNQPQLGSHYQQGFQEGTRGGHKRNVDVREAAEGGSALTPKRRRT